ncbi:MAG: hypothetical protein JW969_04870 [Spirochaetales bacterium]|nr:hypothetical protein [Spirochaetales bacterium]
MLIKNEYPPGIISLFDAGQRKLLKSLYRKAAEFSINQSYTVMTALWREPSDHRYLVNTAKDLVSVCDSLNNYKSSMQKLKKLAEFDPDPGVRMNSLKILVEGFPMDDDVIRILEHGLTSHNIHKRLFTAAHFGEKGLTILRDILATGNLSAAKKIFIIKAFKHNTFLDGIDDLIKIYKKSELSRDIQKEILKAFINFSDRAPGKLDEFLFTALSRQVSAPMEYLILSCLGACGSINTIERLVVMPGADKCQWGIILLGKYK